MTCLFSQIDCTVRITVETKSGMKKMRKGRAAVERGLPITVEEALLHLKWMATRYVAGNKKKCLFMWESFFQIITILVALIDILYNYILSFTDDGWWSWRKNKIFFYCAQLQPRGQVHIIDHYSFFFEIARNSITIDDSPYISLPFPQYLKNVKWDLQMHIISLPRRVQFFYVAKKVPLVKRLCLKKIIENPQFYYSYKTSLNLCLKNILHVSQ